MWQLVCIIEPRIIGSPPHLTENFGLGGRNHECSVSCFCLQHCGCTTGADYEYNVCANGRFTANSLVIIIRKHLLIWTVNYFGLTMGAITLSHHNNREWMNIYEWIAMNENLGTSIKPIKVYFIWNNWICIVPVGLCLSRQMFFDFYECPFVKEMPFCWWKLASVAFRHPWILIMGTLWKWIIFQDFALILTKVFKYLSFSRISMRQFKINMIFFCTCTSLDILAVYTNHRNFNYIWSYLMLMLALVASISSLKA